MILVLGLLLWDRFAVVTRSVTLQVRSLDYVAAAQAVGCSSLRMLASEILPNILNAIIVVATLEMANAILLEAALSFLGLGVPPPLPSWGLMIAEGKDYMFFTPWVITIPGVALFMLVLAINLLGDGVRDLHRAGEPQLTAASRRRGAPCRDSARAGHASPRTRRELRGRARQDALASWANPAAASR